ncbi:hypothetical protein Tco_0300278 [Tanacetum coccineum]
MRSKSTFKVKTLKGVIINEPSSTPAKGNKSSSALKVNSAPTGKPKSVKIEDDPPLATVIKELNDLKLQVSKNQSSQSRDKQGSQNTLQNIKNPQLKRSSELCGLKNHLTEKCYKVLFCMICGKTNHRTCDHAEYMCTINMYQHLKSLGRSSSRSKNPKPSKRFFPPCTHYGSMDHLFDDCLFYPICEIYGSYDHETNSHNRIISQERKINPRNPQHPFKRCEVCGNSIHTTTDHYDIEWFKRDEALQAKMAEDLKGTMLPNANRLKTITKQYFEFERHLEELYVTWAHLEKKRTRLRTYTNITQDNVLSRSTFVGETHRKSDQLHQTFEKSSIAMTCKLDDMIELPKSQPKRTYNEDLECEIIMVKVPKCMAWLDDEPIGDLDTMEDKVDNLTP